MPEAIVIGAGLTGLSAAYELQQRGIETTLIEVKRRVGGSIRTVHQDGYVLDAGAFALAEAPDPEMLTTFGLEDALYQEENGAFFRQGTQTLIDAMAAKIDVPRLMRMAVSSIGELEEGGYSICLENGLLLRAKAVIITVPLRYAERLFYGYITEITERLLQIQTETIQRVSWGFDQDLSPFMEALKAAPEVAFVQQTSAPQRVPDGHTLLQVGVRLDQPAEESVAALRHSWQLPQPVTEVINTPHEALYRPVDLAAYGHTIADVKALLPPEIFLVGSDYGDSLSAVGLDGLAGRIRQGREAVQKSMEFLR